MKKNVWTTEYCLYSIRCDENKNNENRKRISFHLEHMQTTFICGLNWNENNHKYFSFLFHYVAVVISEASVCLKSLTRNDSRKTVLNAHYNFSFYRYFTERNSKKTKMKQKKFLFSFLHRMIYHVIVSLEILMMIILLFWCFHWQLVAMQIYHGHYSSS